MNLLQPTDSRSKNPGDPPETVAARVRVAQAGAESALLEALTAWVGSCALAPGAAVLEVGCGTGELLAGLAAECDLNAFGSDLTVKSLRVAARRSVPEPPRGVRWFATNSDRGLPFADASLALVLTVKAPKPFAEFARVLQPGGRALVATPAPDDLAELRTLTAGASLPRDPALAAAAAAAEAGLALSESFTVRTRRVLPTELCADLLATGYRGARRSEQGRLSGQFAGPVTLSTAVQIFERASAR